MFDKGILIEEIFLYNNCKFKDIKTQLEKIKEECNEVEEAANNYIREPSKENEDLLAGELHDLEQSSHTLMIHIKSRENREKSNHNHLQKMIDRDNEVK